MNFTIYCIGQTSAGYVAEGCADYERRLRHYGAFSWRFLPDIKKTAAKSSKITAQKEGEMFLHEISDSDFVVMLDASGRQRDSIEFSRFIQKIANGGAKRLCFLIGGAFGFSPAVEERANERLSLSLMTFPHDLVRLIFSEQLYRAMTIQRGEKYHHG